MRRHRGATIFVGIIFGFIAFAITVFFVSPKIALAYGGFAALSYIIVLSIIMDINYNKYEHIDSDIRRDIILKDSANYYHGKLIGNGILYLTDDRLIFISLEKKPKYYEEILFSDIKRATYGKIFRHIVGLKLLMSDTSIKGFVLKDFEKYLEHINETLSPNLFEDFEESKSN